MLRKQKLEAQESAQFAKAFLGMGREKYFLQALLPLIKIAAPAVIGGLMNKNKESQQQTVEPGQYDSRNPDRAALDAFLANFVSQYGGQYQPQKPFDGKFTAPMSGYETQGLEQFLSQYLNQPNVSPELQNVRGLLQKNITGGFDPATSDYYGALKKEAGYNQKRAIDANNANLGARKKFFTSEAIRSTGDITAQTGMNLDRILQEIANSERDRQQSSIPQAAALEDYISNIPKDKASAATTIGALPRLLEQKDLESIYQDFLRRQKEGQGVINAAGSVSTTTTEPYAPPTLVAPQPTSSGSTQDFLMKFLGNVVNRASGGTGSSGGLFSSIASLFGGK